MKYETNEKLYFFVCFVHFRIFRISLTSYIPPHLAVSSLMVISSLLSIKASIVFEHPR